MRYQEEGAFMEALVVRRFNANMSVYLYMLIFGPRKGLPLNTFEN